MGYGQTHRDVLVCSNGLTGVSWDSTDDWLVQAWSLAMAQGLGSTLVVCAELLDNIQALDMDSCTFKQLWKMVDDERGLWTCMQGNWWVRVEWGEPSNLNSYESIVCNSRTKLSLGLNLWYTWSYILQKLVHMIPVLVPPNLAPCTLVNTTAAAISLESYEQDGWSVLKRPAIHHSQPSIVAGMPQCPNKVTLMTSGQNGWDTLTYSNRVSWA
jgi:hypothetical protein